MTLPLPPPSRFTLKELDGGGLAAKFAVPEAEEVERDTTHELVSVYALPQPFFIFDSLGQQIERLLEGRKKSSVRQGAVRKYDIEESGQFVWRLLNIQCKGPIRGSENFDPIFILGSISHFVRFESLANLILLTFPFVGLVPPKFLTDSPI